MLGTSAQAPGQTLWGEPGLPHSPHSRLQWTLAGHGWAPQPRWRPLENTAKHGAEHCLGEINEGEEGVRSTPEGGGGGGAAPGTGAETPPQPGGAELALSHLSHSFVCCYFLTALWTGPWVLYTPHPAFAHLMAQWENEKGGKELKNLQCQLWLTALG